MARRPHIVSALFVLLFLMVQGPMARELPQELLEMSVTDLMNLEIYSVSKKEQKLADAAGAIFVITQEDIKRSGATTIPDLLRMVPGVDVARIDANKWAVSVRGFNSRFANKLLVLIDGRTVYTPVYSGVYWDTQDVLLDDVLRIEVIRGPGAALWGANAVNGVINILTKRAQETQGGLITAGMGTEEKGFGSFRYGSKLENGAYYRIYGKVFDRDDGRDSSLGGAGDAWRAYHLGFRSDWEASSTDSWTFQGDTVNGTAGEKVPTFSLLPPYTKLVQDDWDFNDTYVMSKWARTLSPTSDLKAQFYYDFNTRKKIQLGFDVHTVDLDFQHTLQWGERQAITWGAGYRHHVYTLESGTAITTESAQEEDKLFSAFLHDDITLIADRLHFIVGTKIEHNDYSGFEVQPNARLLWTPVEGHSAWTSISRAVRTRSLAESMVNGTLGVIPPGSPENPTPWPARILVFGNDNLASEDLVSAELGYRFRAFSTFWVDLCTFYNVYENLVTMETGKFQLKPLPVPHILVPATAGDNMRGDTYGFEAALEWDLKKQLRFRAAYTLLRMELETTGGSNDRVSAGQVDQSPHHQFSLRCLMDLPHDVTADFWLRFVDRVPSMKTDSYVSGDLRLAWKPWKNFELAVVGQNLFDAQHYEFGKDMYLQAVPTAVERSMYGKITWSF